MRKYSKYELFILLEPFIDNLGINSPLLELILSAPLEEWDKEDIEVKKQELQISLSKEDIILFNDVIAILSNPEYRYMIALTIDNEKFINELYENNGKIVEYVYNSNKEFVLNHPFSHKEKLGHYIDLLDVSEYELDYKNPRHIFSFEEYLVLNVAFDMEEISRNIGEIEKDLFTNFTIDDIKEELQDENYKIIEEFAVFFKEEDKPNNTINVVEQVDSLLQKGYLKRIDDDSLELGDKSIFLFENLHLLNDIRFSFYFILKFK